MAVGWIYAYSIEGEVAAIRSGGRHRGSIVTISIKGCYKFIFGFNMPGATEESYKLNSNKTCGVETC